MKIPRDVTRDNLRDVIDNGYTILCMGGEVYQSDDKEHTIKHIKDYMNRGYEYIYLEPIKGIKERDNGDR